MALMIFHQIEPEIERNAYRIVETFPCVDGYRTRVTNHSFSTLEQAQHFIKENKS